MRPNHAAAPLGLSVNSRTLSPSSKESHPGVGKTTYHKNNPETTLDSDSSGFSWVVNENGEKVRNSEFPQNYINHIKENIGKYKYIFVSSHKEVRDALLDNCLYFYLVYPTNSRKEEFIQRYRDRGNDKNFIKLVKTNWEEWMSEFYWMDEITNVLLSFIAVKEKKSIGVNDNDIEICKKYKLKYQVIKHERKLPESTKVLTKNFTILRNDWDD
jgi:hypothetical protein